MSSKVTFDGVEELHRLLRTFPEILTAEGQRIAEGTANAMASDIRQAYPVRKTGLHPGPRRQSPWYAPGNLLARIAVTHFDRGKFIAGSMVKNRAPHAYIFENGTDARHYYESSGKRHATGKMPPGRVFIPAAMRWRARMRQELIAMVERHGFRVTRAA